jgi:hypothetical protein
MRPTPYQILRALLLSGLIACQPREAPGPSVQRLSLTPLPSPVGVRAAEPFVSTARNENVSLSWLERGDDSVTVTLRLAMLDSAGVWSAPVEVTRARNLFVNWADFPSVVTLADGRLLAHWLQKNGAGKYAYDVRLAQSADSGRTWTPSVTPHGEGIQAEHGFVTLLPRDDGSAEILFLNGRVAPPLPSGVTPGAEGHGPPMRLAHARWDRDGRVTATPTMLDERTCDCCQTAAAVTTRGPVVLYRDRSETETRDISVRRLVDGAWTPSVPLHADNWTIDACPVNGPAIAAVGDTVAAVWFTAARDTAKVQLAFSTDAGATFGAPVRIDAGVPAGRVDVEMLGGDDAIVTWIERTARDTAEVRARVVRRDGTTEPPLTVARLPQGRASGFPRMARRRATALVLAWTVPATPAAPATVQLAELRLAPR